MKDKCEWKDGEFEGCCKKIRGSWGDANKIVIDIYGKWLSRIDVSYCPFCGADIRKPEPKQPTREELSNKIDDAINYLNCGNIHERKTIIDILTRDIPTEAK